MQDVFVKHWCPRSNKIQTGHFQNKSQCHGHQLMDPSVKWKSFISRVFIGQGHQLMDPSVKWKSFISRV